MSKGVVIPKLTPVLGYNANLPQPPLPIPMLDFTSVIGNASVNDYSVADYNSYGNNEVVQAGTITTIETELATVQNQISDTVNTALQNAVPITGGYMTGPLVLNDHSLAASQNYVDTQLDNVVPIAGGTMTGELELNPATQTGVNDAITVGQVNDAIATVSNNIAADVAYAVSQIAINESLGVNGGIF